MMSKRTENKNLFNKEPKVYFKEHPGDMGYDHEPSIHDSREKTNQAALRNRSPSGYNRGSRD